MRMHAAVVMLCVGCGADDTTAADDTPALHDVRPTPPQGRCTDGTDPARCKLADCYHITPNFMNFTVDITNTCDHPVVFGTPMLNDRYPGFWSVRLAETGAPLQMINFGQRFAAPANEPFWDGVTVTIEPHEKAKLFLPTTNGLVADCDDGDYPMLDETLIGTLLLPTPVLEGAEPPGTIACHSNGCGVEGDTCGSLPNFIVYEDVVTFNRQELCDQLVTMYYPNYCSW